MSNSSAYNFGYYLIPALFIICIIWGLWSVLWQAQKDKEKKIAVENEKRKIEVQETYLYNKILREEGVPDSAVKIFLCSFLDEQKKSVDIPAFLWKVNESYQLLPLTQGLIKLFLDTKETGSIIVEENLIGAFPVRDYCISKNSIPFHKEFEGVLPKQANDYNVKKPSDAGRYFFAGYRITPNSAIAINREYNIPFSHALVNIPIYNFKIKKIMYSDSVITASQYDEYKINYLKYAASVTLDKNELQESLLQLMRDNLISRNDVVYWTEATVDSKYSDNYREAILMKKAPLDSLITIQSDYEKKKTHAFELINQGLNLNDISRETNLDQETIYTLFYEKEQQEREENKLKEEQRKLREQQQYEERKLLDEERKLLDDERRRKWEKEREQSIEIRRQQVLEKRKQLELRAPLRREVQQREGEETLKEQQQYEESNTIENAFDYMEGHDFEYFCATLLEKNGYSKIQVTKGSGDQGIDIIAYKDDIRFGIQCKRFSSPIGNHAIQEVFAGKSYYNCHIGIVITNNYFTSSAIELAKHNGIILWDREKLLQLIKAAKL